MTGEILFLSLYLGAQIGIGFWVSRRIRNEADYVVAGRSLGPLLVSASVFATWFGAEACVGAAGEVYGHGLRSVSSDPFGYGLAVVIFGLVLAAPLYRRGLMTLADLFRARYGASVERVVAVLLIPGSLLWAAAQIRAFGQILSSTVGVDVTAAIVIAAAVCVLYTSLGGMLADAYTDLIQGGALVIGLVLLAAIAFSRASPEAISAAFALSEDAQRGSLLATMEAWAIPVVGSLMAQELAAKTLAARSATVARRATAWAGVAYLALGAIPVALGALARVELPGLEESDQILSAFAAHHLGAVGRLFFVGALLSAILSTVDSALLVAGSVFARNLAGPITGHRFDALKLARRSVVLFGALATLFAVVGKSVHDLVYEASAFGSAGVVVCGLFGLFTKLGGPRAAMSALVAGAATYVTLAHALIVEAPYVGALAVSGAAFVGVALFERSREGSPRTAHLSE
jgi:Na+/proline symporter